MSTYQIPNHQVFDLVEASAQAIDAYLHAGEKAPMQAALDKINSGGFYDPNAKNPLVLNYRAIMEDLLGEYDKALGHLRELKTLTPSTDREVQKEIDTNIGVVRQHWLRRLMTLQEEPSESVLGELGAKSLDELMSSALSDIFPHATENKIWSAHHDALSARFLALRCIPNIVEVAEHDRALRHELAEAYAKATMLAESVLDRWAPLAIRHSEPREGWKQAKAIAHNALGRAAMYHTDFFCPRGEKVQHLAQALTHLERAQRAFDDDWSFTSDLGSCHMRLGYWGHTAAEYELAKKQLDIVLDKLRPEWGFALFEMGRVYRLNRKFEEASDYFKRAKAIPMDERDVSDLRVDREMRLSAEELTKYP